MSAASARRSSVFSPRPSGSPPPSAGSGSRSSFSPRSRSSSGGACSSGLCPLERAHHLHAALLDQVRAPGHAELKHDIHLGARVPGGEKQNERKQVVHARLTSEHASRFPIENARIVRVWSIR